MAALAVQPAEALAAERSSRSHVPVASSRAEGGGAIEIRTTASSQQKQPGKGGCGSYKQRGWVGPAAAMARSPHPASPQVEVKLFRTGGMISIHPLTANTGRS